MTKAEIKKLVAVINANFKPPFLPKGAVKASVDKNGFVLVIGPRDVSFDKDLNVLSVGTFLRGV